MKKNLGIILCLMLSYSQPGLSNESSVPFLGSGFISATETLVDPCLVINDENIRYSGAQTSSINFVKNTSLEQMLGLFDLSFSGKIDLAGLSMSGAQKYAFTMAEDSYSDSIAIQYKVSGKTATFDNASPTKNIAQLLDSTKGDEKVQVIKSHCGDRFVSSVDLGAELIIGFKVTYVNKSLKTVLSAQLKADILGLLNGSGHGSAVINKYSNKASISLAALQRGGDVTQLTKALNADKDNVFHIYNCGLNSVATEDTNDTLKKITNDSCIKALDGMLSYMRNDFPDQVANLKYEPFLNKGMSDKTEGKNATYSGAAILNAKTMSYEEGGYPHLLKGSSPKISAQIQNQRDNLIKYYKKILFFLNRIDLYVNISHLDENDKLFLNKNKDLASETFNLLSDAANSCYAYNPDPAVKNQENDQMGSLCKDQYDLFSKKLKDVKKIIESPDSLVFKQTFYHSCRLRLEVENKTICPLVKKIAIYFDQDINKDKFCSEKMDDTEDDYLCDQLNSTLLKSVTLDISEKVSNEKISDISALGELPKLTRLYLSGNKLKNLGSLSKNSNIREVYMKDNQVTGLTQFQNLSGLKFLDVSNNQIEYFTCEPSDSNCFSWRENKTINLSGNDLKEVDKLDLTNLTTLFQNNSTFEKLIYTEKESNKTILCVRNQQPGDNESISKCSY